MNDPALLEELAQLAARQTGLRLPAETQARFLGILRERARRRGFASLEEYRAFLAGGQAGPEWEEIACFLTSGETFFFRDHGQFDLLRFRLLPELIERRHSRKILRLWSAGCATGEEAYSLAILVDLLLPEYRGWNILILGTDINREALAKARRGRYGQWSFRMVPPTLQQRYFRREGEEWVLDEHIRRMVTFRASNLVREPFPAPGSDLHDMDLILCRNVFIYFSPDAVAAVAAKLAAALGEEGYLMTAHTELIGHPVQGLEPRLFAEGVVYQRVAQAPYVPHPNLPPQAGEGVKAPSLARSAGEGWGGGALPATPGEENLFAMARKLADRGEYPQAEQVCRQALAAAPLAAGPHFLLAQLAQLRGDFEEARGLLNKAIYLDPRFVAAYLELAALCERAGDIARAQTLRRAALGIARTLPKDEVIEQYEMTAGELAQGLAQ